MAAPSRQGKGCQPSFYLVPRVCALKEARSAPGGRRMKPQPPPPLPRSAAALEGLKPGMDVAEGAGGSAGALLGSPVRTKADRTCSPSAVPYGGEPAPATARPVPRRRETPSASAAPLASSKAARSRSPHTPRGRSQPRVPTTGEPRPKASMPPPNGPSQNLPLPPLSRRPPPSPPLRLSSPACPRPPGLFHILFFFLMAKTHPSG